MILSRIFPQKLAERELRDALEDIKRILNGGIEFGNGKSNSSTINMAGVTVLVASSLADTDFTITHNLGVIPTGWIVLTNDVYCRVKKGATIWNSKQIFLKCDQANVNFLIFIVR